MAIRPLFEAPLLDNLLRWLQLSERARNVSAKKAESTAFARFKLLGGCSCESSDPLWIRKGRVELIGVGSELGVSGDGGDIDLALTGGTSCNATRLTGATALLGSIYGITVAIRLRRCKSRLMIFIMLNVFCVSGNKLRSKCDELLPQLRRELLADELFDRLFAA